MDMEEVQKWILPTDYDHTEAEAKHLVNNMVFFYKFVRLIIIVFFCYICKLSYLLQVLAVVASYGKMTVIATRVDSCYSSHMK